MLLFVWIPEKHTLVYLEDVCSLSAADGRIEESHCGCGRHDDYEYLVCNAEGWFVRQPEDERWEQIERPVEFLN